MSGVEDSPGWLCLWSSSRTLDRALFLAEPQFSYLYPGEGLCLPCLYSPFQAQNNKAIMTMMTMPVCTECLLWVRHGSVSPRILT